MAVPRKLEVERDTLELVDNFCYLGDLILCEGGVESAGIGYSMLGVNGGNW